MKKNFLFCTGLMATGYLVFSLVYFTQMYLLYDYFPSDTVYVITTGWAYIAQAVGMGLFAFIYWKAPRIIAGRYFSTAMYIFGAVLLCVTLPANNTVVLVILMMITNLLIGIETGFVFSLSTAHVPRKQFGFSFGLAYALGSLGTWFLSLLDAELLTSVRIIPVGCVLFGIAIVLVFICQNLPFNFSETEDKKSIPAGYIKYLIAILILMMFVSTFGSNSYSLLTQDAGISVVAARGFYAIGLLIAGIICDRSRWLGAVCTLASLVYPVIATVLYGYNELLSVVCSLSYVILGFIAVYRAITFMDLGADNKKYLPLACGGLLLSRVVEAVATFANEALAEYPFAGLIISGILFIPLIVVFCVMQTKLNTVSAQPLTEEMRLAAFGDRFGLTGREQEVLQLLVNGSSNGEIATALHLSESTVRFHTANLFKKTGCGGRVEVGRLFRQMVM